MNIKTITLIFLSISSFVISQTSNLEEGMSSKSVETNNYGQQVTTFQPSSFIHTIPARDLPQVEEGDVSSQAKVKIRNNFERDGYLEAQNALENDPVVQNIAGTKSGIAPIVNMNGQSGSGLPPDPTGAASANYYVQGVNTSIRCYTSSGNVVPGGSFSLSALWSGSNNAGDPIVMYDRHADRWFISQFNS